MDMFPIVKEMRISRIDGIEYPSAEVENVMFNQYFEKPKLVQRGTCICLFRSSFESLDPLPMSYMIDDFHAYPYKILDLTSKQNQNQNQNQNGRERSMLFLASRSETKLFMRNSCKVRLQFAQIMDSFASSLQLHQRYGATDVPGGISSNSISSNSMVQSVLLPAPFSMSSSQRLYTNESIHSSDISCEPEIDRNDLNCSSRLIERLTTLASPIFQLPFLDYDIKLELMKRPVMVDYGSDMYIEDMKQSLEITAFNLKVGIVAIDARQLYHYPANKLKETALLEELESSHSHRSNLLSENFISNIVDMAPCIVHIQSTHLLQKATAIAQSSGLTNDINVEEVFSSALQAFTKDLIKALKLRHLQNLQNQTNDQDGDRDRDQKDRFQNNPHGITGGGGGGSTSTK